MPLFIFRSDHLLEKKVFHRSKIVLKQFFYFRNVEFLKLINLLEIFVIPDV